LERRLYAAEGAEERRQLSEAYFQVAARMRGVMEIEQAKAKGEKEHPGVKRWLEAKRELAEELGEEVGTDDEEIDRLLVEMEMAPSGGGMREAAASMRVVLRKVMRMAEEAEDGMRYAQMARLYGTGCMQLARFLKHEPERWELAGKALTKAFYQALAQVNEELGLRKD
jgi:hypothetical protein